MSSPSYVAPAEPPVWTLGPEAEWAARAAGFTCFPWQADVLARAMATAGPGDDTLLQQQITLVCPRRNGKTQLVMARILAGALAWNEPAILYTAHLGDTARHTFTAFLELLNHSPWLRSQVARISYGKGDESVRFRNGSQFFIRARTAAGGRGLECSTLILDEALELHEDHIAALTPLLAKATAQGHGQLWLVSSAGHGRSDVLARSRDRGRSSDPGAGHAYFEWTAARSADPADPAVWAAANPSLGTPILSSDFLALQQRSMSSEDFGREHLGWWTAETSTPFLPHGAWQITAIPPPPLPARPRVALGMELAEFGTAASLTAAVALPDGQVWVEVLQRWRDADGLHLPTIASEAAAVARRHRAVAVIGDEFTCTDLLQHVAAAGIPVSPLNQPQLRAASQALLVAVTSGRLLHPHDPQMETEMGNAGQAPTGDGLTRLSRKNRSGPATDAWSVAAAAWAILAPEPIAPKIVTAA